MTTIEAAALRPSVLSMTVIEAVAQEIVGELASNTGGYGEKAALKHIVKLLEEHRFDDGYRLTKRLEQDFGWINCDMRIATVMDEAYTMMRAEVRKQTEAWVARNAIQPQKAVGDPVSFQFHGTPVVGTIASIVRPHAQYVVSVPELGHSGQSGGVSGSPAQDGLVVNFEDIHDLAEPPDKFELRVQE